jgi:hypothetical protein
MGGTIETTCGSLEYLWRNAPWEKGMAAYTKGEEQCCRCGKPASVDLFHDGMPTFCEGCAELADAAYAIAAAERELARE